MFERVKNTLWNALVDPHRRAVLDLLAPGHFADRCRAEAATGALVAGVIGAQSLIVERVVRQGVPRRRPLRLSSYMP